MTTALANVQSLPSAETLERLIIHGDLSKLSPAEKTQYYLTVCQALDLNPATQPFAYLTLNGKQILYARKECTEQLRKKHEVSVTIVARESVEGCYVVTARAELPSGRHDSSIGAVPIEGLKGEARANALMKAETKSKRRVTLSICGLGMLDETEVETIHGAARAEPPAKPLPAPKPPAAAPTVQASAPARGGQHAEPPDTWSGGDEPENGGQGPEPGEQIGEPEVIDIARLMEEADMKWPRLVAWLNSNLDAGWTEDNKVRDLTFGQYWKLAAALKRKAAQAIVASARKAGA